LFYGGARFGGKSDFLLADFLDGVRFGEHHKGIFFRRSYNELEEILSRSRQIYPPLGATYSETKRTWLFNTGSTLKLRFLEQDKDVHRYQGHQYTWVGFDELTNYPTDYPFIYMFTCARSPQGLPVRVRASGNPGSVGHSWVKARFVDVCQEGRIYRDPRTGLGRCFIRSSLDDNSYAKNDPQYELRLKNLPPHLYRAHRWGDWDVFVGQAFDFNRDYHVISPMPIPEWAPIYTTFDWGFGAPFSWGWWWIDSQNRAYRFSEWYGDARSVDPDGKLNEGLRYEDSRLAEGINRREAELKQQYGMLDLSRVIRLAGPDCFQKKPDYKGGGQGKSTAEVFSAHGIFLTRADPSRVLKIRQFRERLRIRRHPETNQVIEQPMMQIYDTCFDFIRTIPMIQTDPKHPEDVLTEGEDHVYDETCHICMARPMSLPQPAKILTSGDRHIQRIETKDPQTWEEYAIREQKIAIRDLQGYNDPSFEQRGGRNGYQRRGYE